MFIANEDIIDMFIANDDIHIDYNDDDGNIDDDDKDSDSSGNDTGDEDPDDPDFIDKLREWVLHTDTPHSHTNSLLAILKVYFPSLPKDSRTLLTTRKTYNIEDLSGGKYHNFGISEGIKSRLQRQEHLFALNNISLQLNIDGLPQFKSSSQSFCPYWEEEKPEPFVIGLWVGSSKPTDSNAFLRKFVNEMVEIQDHGVNFNDNIYTINITNLIYYTPARAFFFFKYFYSLFHNIQVENTIQTLHVSHLYTVYIFQH
jgi:hypothetical protein